MPPYRRHAIHLFLFLFLTLNITFQPMTVLTDMSYQLVAYHTMVVVMCVTCVGEEEEETFWMGRHKDSWERRVRQSTRQEIHP